MQQRISRHIGKHAYEQDSFELESSNRPGTGLGHHVQNLLGILNKVQKEKSNVSATKQNALQVKVELQADCYSGVWAHHSKAMFDSIEEGDLEAGLKAASAIGDDTLQKKSQGYVVPDSFTHGTSNQRMEALKKGFYSGDIKDCSF
jgi:predicted metalloprotease